MHDLPHHRMGATFKLYEKKAVGLNIQNQTRVLRIKTGMDAILNVTT